MNHRDINFEREGGKAIVKIVRVGEEDSWASASAQHANVGRHELFQARLLKEVAIIVAIIGRWAVASGVCKLFV